MMCIIEGLKGGPWSPELPGAYKLEKGPDLKGGTSDPSSYHVFLISRFLVNPLQTKIVITTEPEKPKTDNDLMSANW